MPTPPIGDMACAASPMQRRPGRCQRCNLSTRTVSRLIELQSTISPVRPAANGAFLRDARAKGFHALFLQLIDRTFGDHAAALPILAAVDEDEDLSGLEAAHRIPRVFRSSGDPKPKNIHRCADLVDRKPSRVPDDRVPP